MAFPSEDPINTHQQGQRVKLFVDFTDAAGAAADPDLVLLRYLEGDDNLIDILQGSLANPAVGRWEFETNMPLDGNKAGPWTYRYEGTSVLATGVNAVDEKRLEVEPSPFYPPT